jgi:hypothetical protein
MSTFRIVRKKILCYFGYGAKIIEITCVAHIGSLFGPKRDQPRSELRGDPSAGANAGAQFIVAKTVYCAPGLVRLVAWGTSSDNVDVSFDSVNGAILHYTSAPFDNSLFWPSDRCIVLLMPCLRQTSPVLAPASCSRKSDLLFREPARLHVQPLAGDGLYPFFEEIEGLSLPTL